MKIRESLLDINRERVTDDVMKEDVEILLNYGPLACILNMEDDWIFRSMCIILNMNENEEIFTKTRAGESALIQFKKLCMEHRKDIEKYTPRISGAISIKDIATEFAKNDFENEKIAKIIFVCILFMFNDIANKNYAN